jgi:hypothetical protein
LALPRKNFTSKLDGKNTYDYTSHIDYSIDTQQERINKVCEIFKNDDFYVDYFDNYFKVSPNTKEFLSIDNNVCNSLERFADYILLAPDKREEYRKGTRYIFYTEDKMNERIQREKSLEAITEQNDSSKYEETIMFLVDKGKNYKKEIKQDIFESDYDDTEIGLYLTDYKDVLDHYSQLFKDDKIINFKQRKQIKKLMREIKYDRLILKDKLKGTIYFESLLSESTCPDLYLINFTDKKHILYLLKCHKGIY